ncbi:hypothetical protein MBANPS3_004539 [Mucor bainieri]
MCYINILKVSLYIALELFLEFSGIVHHCAVNPSTTMKSIYCMPGDSTLASNAGFLKRQLVMLKDNYNLLFDGVSMRSQLEPSPGIGSTIVPSDNTPYIQWKGHKFNTKRFIYPTMDACCFQQFEDVLESRSMDDLETNWKRIIKPKMSTGMAEWTRRLIKQHPAITWGQFKAQLKVKYSPVELEEKKICLHKLKTLKLKQSETLEDGRWKISSIMMNSK